MGNFPRSDLAPKAMRLIHRAAVQCTGWSAPLSELLEPRRLLSSTPAPSRGSLASLDASLQETYQEYQQFLSAQPVTSTKATTKAQKRAKATAITAVSATFQPSNTTLSASEGRIPVQAFAKPGEGSLLQAALSKLSGQKVSLVDREVDATIPIADLPALNKLKSLRFAEASASVVNVGAVTSQGDTADQAAIARADYGINGAGVTVGIISDSFNNNNKNYTDTYNTDVSSGDLPAGVVDLNDGVPGTDEGRAIAQVIYDSAPGVNFVFSTGAQGQTAMLKDIQALVNAGAKIIVSDITNETEPMFTDGIVASAAEKAISEGVTYIAAAGNNGANSYASAWRSGPSLSGGTIPTDPNAFNAPSYFYGGVAFNFNTTGGTTDTESFTLAPGAVFNPSLQWDSPYYSNGGPGTANQVDCYVLNSAGTMIEGGSAAQVTQINGQGSDADPIQNFSFQNSTGSTQTYKLMICCSYGTVPGYIKYVDFAGQATNWQFAQNSSTIFGVANASGVESVGAVNYANTPAYNVSTPVVESYSGTGGTPIIFNTNGTKLQTYGYRQSPEVVAPDGVFTTFFGTKTGNNAYPTFSGTSAAAAEVAGMAAILLQKDPQFTPAQVDATLNGYTIKMGSTSPNNQSGYGLVQALPVIANSVGNITGTVYSDNNANGIADPGEPGLANAIVFIDKFNSGVLEPGDPVTTSGTNGAFAFYNQSLGSTVVRAITLTGYVPTVNSQTVNVLGATTVSGVYLGMFPTDFVGTNGNYNYTLQVDAQKPADIDILVGSVEVYIVPISLIATGLTFDLEGGNSTLNVNFANGDPVPGGGVQFTPTGSGNSLVINGSAGADTVVVDGTTTDADGSPGVNATDVQSEIINGNGGNDDFTIATPQPSGESLTFNGGLGTTTLNVESPENPQVPVPLVGTTFNSGTSSGDAGVLNVSSGIVWTFSGNPAATSSALTVNDMGDVIFSAGSFGSGINTRQLSALNIGAGASATVAAPPINNSTGHANQPDRALLLLSTVSIATTGILDLNANDLVVTNTNLATINALLASGYNNGAWNGPGGIESTAAATDATHLTALGSLLNNLNGTRLYSSGATLGKFDGITSISSSAIIVKYTYYGDTDLSGAVDGSDYSRLDNGYLSNGTLTGWYNGDSNYDSVIDGSDYTLMDNAFNMQRASL